MSAPCWGPAVVLNRLAVAVLGAMGHRQWRAYLRNRRALTERPS